MYRAFFVSLPSEKRVETQLTAITGSIILFRGTIKYACMQSISKNLKTDKEI